MTHDYDERSSLNGYRMVFSISGGLLAIILATVLGWLLPGDRKVQFMIIAAVLGITAIIPPLVVFNVTRDHHTDNPDNPLSVKDAIKTTLKNRPFWMVMGLYLFSWTTASVMAAVIVYFVNYYLRIPDQANYFVLVSQISAIAFVPFWVWVAQKLDKRLAFIIGTGTWAVVLALIALIRPDQIGLAYILAALSGSGIATAYVLPWSMIPDIIEMDELETGQRREGSFYAFASFFQKLGTGIAIWLMGQALSAAGYITPIEGNPLPIQPVGAVNAIRLAIGAVPAVLVAIAIVFAWQYPITREKHREILNKLAQKVKAGSAV
jgi:GPH family glycoside/pentoside/hexuronide:cation symporter